MLYDTIKDIASKRNVAIRKMEQDLGFANGSIRKWDGDNLISLAKVKAVAKYLHVDPYTLLLVGVDLDKVKDE